MRRRRRLGCDDDCAVVCNEKGVVDNDEDTDDGDDVVDDVVGHDEDMNEGDVVVVKASLVMSSLEKLMSATFKKTIDGSSAMHIVPKDTFFLLCLDGDESDDGDDDNDFKSCANASSSARPPDDSSSFTCSLLDDDDDDGSKV